MTTIPADVEKKLRAVLERIQARLTDANEMLDIARATARGNPDNRMVTETAFRASAWAQARSILVNEFPFLKEAG